MTRDDWGVQSWTFRPSALTFDADRSFPSSIHIRALGKRGRISATNPNTGTR